MFIYKLFSNNFARYLRNFLNIKPTIAYKPNNTNNSISDFFFWEETDKLHTKFFLTNLASQVLPDIKQIDFIKIFIYDDKGNLLKELHHKLDYSETFILNFNSLKLKGFGSFFVFHKFNDNYELIKKKAHLADRGYIGYSDDSIFWKYIHGNNYAAYFDEKKNKIKSIMTKTIRKYNYIPQLTFQDCKGCNLIINNPDDNDINIELKTYLNSNKFNQNNKFIISKKGTLKISINDIKFKYIEIKSHFVMLRPIVFKNYLDDFDVFHG